MLTAINDGSPARRSRAEPAAPSSAAGRISVGPRDAAWGPDAGHSLGVELPQMALAGRDER